MLVTRVVLRSGRHRAELVALLLEVPRRSGVDVVEERVPGGRADRLDLGDRGGDLGVELLLERRVLLVFEEASPDEVAAKARERIALHPDIDLGLGAVAGGVVARRVRADAVGQGLDERRSAAASR